eukprot:2133114-Amphidinium_carterae.1
MNWHLMLTKASSKNPCEAHSSTLTCITTRSTIATKRMHEPYRIASLRKVTAANVVHFCLHLPSRFAPCVEAATVT